MRESDVMLAIQEMQEIAETYSAIKDTATYAQIQDLRDRLELLRVLYTIDLEANARIAYEEAALKNKRRNNELYLNYAGDVGKGKTFTSKEDAKAKAFLDCEQEQKDELEKYRSYLIVKEAKETINTFTHSVASRLRGIE